MYPLVETIKIQEGDPLHLEWHQRRMDFAFHDLLGIDNPFLLSERIIVPTEFISGVVKCRFLYNGEDFITEFFPYNKRRITSLRIVQCDWIDYTHKYTNRAMINDLFSGRGEADDILIVRDGFITDTSYANILFHDGENWFTPSDPLLEGTARNRLLAEGKIEKAAIRPEDLSSYNYFRLVNAMMEFEDQEDIPVARIFKE